MTEKENVLAYLRGEKYDAKPKYDVLAFGNPPEVSYAIDLPFCERPQFESGYDVFGVHWTRSVEGCHWTPGQDTVLKDIENWRDEVRIPNADKFDWDYVRKQAEGIDRSKTVVTCTLIMGIFERLTALTSFEDALFYTAAEPELCEELLHALADYKIAIIEKLAEYFCPDVLLIHDDWGTTKAPFLSPTSWRELIRPNTQRIYDACTKHGIIVAQHSCGNITPIVGDMVEMGCRMWEGQEYCNDAAWLREQYGQKMHLNLVPLLSSDDLKALDAKMPPPDAVRNIKPYAEKPDFLYD